MERSIDDTLLDESQPFLATDPSTGASKTLNGLDIRLVKALNKMDFIYPTIIQQKAISLGLQGKDLLIKAKTGSGKTIAYLLPLLQKILIGSKVKNSGNGIQAIVMLPSNELAHQTFSVIKMLTRYCDEVISVLNLNDGKLSTVLKNVKRMMPKILVGTPGKLLTLFQKLDSMNTKNESKKLAFTKQLKLSLETLALDEADLMCEFQYKDDIEAIIQTYTPRSCQCFIISATLLSKPSVSKQNLDSDSSINFLKSLVLHNPAILTLNPSPDDESFNDLKDGGSITNLNQFYVIVKDAAEKDVLLYVLIKLGLVNGKILFFVNSTTASYRFQLLLEQFCVTGCIVLNNMLPINNRLNKIKLFNKGLVDLVIAADQVHINRSETQDNAGGMEKTQDAIDGSSNLGANEQSKGSEEADAESGKEEEEEEGEDENEVGEEGEFSISRGLDFKGVNFVVNLEVPESVEEYVHRVGRTARAGMFGTSLTIIQSDHPHEMKLLTELQQELPRKVINGEEKVQPCPLVLDMKELDPFRYRVNDVRKRVTKRVVEETQLKELKLELLTNEKVKQHFENNPRDLIFLAAAKANSLHGLKTKKVTNSVGVVPKYLLPNNGQNNGTELIQKVSSAFGSNPSNKRKWQMKHKKGRFSNKFRRKGRKYFK